jgi:hypothetical protein
MVEWKRLRRHDIQSRLWKHQERFPVVYAGRGSGKTELARRRVVRYLPVKKPWVTPQYFYGLPTYGQAKRVAWDHLKSLIPSNWIKKVYESSLVIKTVFGSELHLVGLDKPARIEGTQWDGGVLDECSDQQPKVFDLSVRPTLSHKTGWCWRIGVPKRFGIGAAEFHKACMLGETDEDPDVKTYTWTSEDILTAIEIESAKRNLSPEDYAEQFLASWKSVAGLVYHAFSDVLNVTTEVTYRPSLPIIVGSDFNVDPMCWTLCHMGFNGLACFDEIHLRNTNTRATLDELYKRYGQHKAGFMFLGDASGRARKTSASSTDYIQIKTDPRFKDSKVYYLKANPPINDRVASCNALFCNANDERRFFVHPRCKVLIKDLTSLAYKPGGREIELKSGLGHMSDALGYIIYKVFPLRMSSTSVDKLVISG